MEHRDVISWTAMMSAYLSFILFYFIFLSISLIICNYNLHNKPQQTLKLYGRMIKENTYPNQLTYGCLFAACADLKNLETGQMLYDQLLSSNPTWLEVDVVHNSVVSMYYKCSMLDKAVQVSFFNCWSYIVASLIF